MSGSYQSNNIAIGLSAMENYSYDNAQYCVAIGNSALIGGGVTGAAAYNIAIGHGNLQNVTTGGNNTAIGGNSTLTSLTTGTSNVAIARGAGQTMTTTSNTILIGADAGNTLTGTGPDLQRYTMEAI